MANVTFQFSLTLSVGQHIYWLVKSYGTRKYNIKMQQRGFRLRSNIVTISSLFKNRVKN